MWSSVFSIRTFLIFMVVNISSDAFLINLFDKAGHFIRSCNVGRKYHGEVFAIGFLFGDQPCKKFIQFFGGHILNLYYPIVEVEIMHNAARFVFIFNSNGRDVAGQTENDRMQASPYNKSALGIYFFNFVMVNFVDNLNGMCSALNRKILDSFFHDAIIVGIVARCDLWDKDGFGTILFLYINDKPGEGGFVLFLFLAGKPISCRNTNVDLISGFASMFEKWTFVGKSRIDRLHHAIFLNPNSLEKVITFMFSYKYQPGCIQSLSYHSALPVISERAE